jgi:cyanate permease
MENQKNMYRWLVIILLFLNMFFGTIAAHCIPPLFSEIVKEIPLTKTQMGTVMGTFAVAALFFAPLGGGLSDKIGCRWVLGGAAIIMAAGGGIRYFAGSATAFIICMFFLGAGFAVFMALMPKVLSTWFLPKELATMNAICFASITFGAAIAQGTAVRFMSPAFNGWRGTTLVLAGICLVMALLWLFFYRDWQTVTDAQNKEENIASKFRKVLKIKDIRLIALYYGFVYGALMTILTLLPITLQEKGVIRAGELISIMLAASLIFKIVGGIVSDKVGKRKVFLVVCAIIFGLCMPGFIMFTGVPLIIALVIAGAAFGPMPPIVMTASVEIKQIGTLLAGTALGFITMIGTVGGFIGPLAVGMVMDASGSAWLGFIFMGVVGILAGLIVIPAKIK